MKENPEQNKCIKESPSQGIIKETNTEITSLTQVTEKELLEDCTIEPIKNTVSEDSAESKIVFAQKKTKSKLCVKRRDPCLTCNNYIQSIIPLCIWYQNKNYIFLKFNILEIDDFSLNCTAESIIFKYELSFYIMWHVSKKNSRHIDIFRAQFKDTTYNFCVKLFGLINDENVTHKTSYEGFHIKAEKLYKTSIFIDC